MIGDGYRRREGFEMSDIVKRLNDMDNRSLLENYNDMDEAVDEIEALRADNATLRSALQAHGEEAAKLVQVDPVAWLYRDCGSLHVCHVSPPPDDAFPVYAAPPTCFSSGDMADA